MSIVSRIFSHKPLHGHEKTHAGAVAPGLLVGAALLSAVSAVWIDRPLARFIAHWLPPGRTVPDSLPDLLVPFVAILSCLMLAVWMWTWSRGRGDSRLGRLAPLVTLGLPLAFALKSLSKWIFGRTETRMFLSAHHACDFCHWFKGIGPYWSFPSGHMLVLTTLLVLFCRIYPGFRHYATAFLVALGIALLATSYHFLGDVLGGWFFGYLLALVILKADAGLHSAAIRRKPA